ncbi:MAG: glutamate-cysteine ligase family protein, partial [Myxococcota bacterium]
GGQFELAARPVDHADAMKTDLYNYVREIAEPSRRFGLAWLGVGFRPFGRLSDVPWMPKQRYAVMREYMPTRGALAHEMMKRTATVQVNLDYSDPDDAAAKLRAMMSVTSILTAIFANSPIVDDAVSGFQSYRARIWHDTDPDRCGLLPFVFDDGDIFTAYVNWALDIPLFFVYRDGYQPAGGMTFRRFLAEGWNGHRATLDDWALHLSTLFPEARMKKFIEVRGCDSGSMEMVLALAPLCRGLFYDPDALRAATALTAGLDFDQRVALSRDVARRGLSATLPGDGRSVGELAGELLAIAEDGLRRQMASELSYLEPIRTIVGSGRTQADNIIDHWRQTSGDPDQIIPLISHRCLGAEPGADDDCG